MNIAVNAQSPMMQAVPIISWGCDLCGLFVMTSRGNQYVSMIMRLTRLLLYSIAIIIMIAIEYYSKHVELKALLVPCDTVM